MRSKIRFVSYGLLLATCVPVTLAQQPAKAQASPQPSAAAPVSSTPQTENIPSAQPAQASNPAAEPGFMEPAQVKALAHKIRLLEYHINDLLTDVHPEKWRTSSVTRDSFNQMLQALRQVLGGLEESRKQLEERPDSMYYGFQTYAAMNAALPRLDGVARAVSQFQNTSFGAQYSQAANQLFDLQQTLQPYVAYLLRSPDEALDVAQNNLAACQSKLGQAMHGQTEPATPLKNTFVELHTKRHRKPQPDAGGNSPQGVEKPAGKTDNKPPNSK